MNADDRLPMKRDPAPVNRDLASTNRTLFQQAETAARQGHNGEARRLLKTILRRDPTNAQALLLMVYVAEDGQASLTYLARLLDAHPRHPQARSAIRWARRRIPTSVPTTPRKRPRASTAPHRLIFGLVFLVTLAGLGLIWQIIRPAATPAQANALSATPQPTGSASTRSIVEIIQISIPRFTPTTAPSPTPDATATPTLSSAWVPVLGQPQSRNLSCESRSVADLSSHWGVSVDEMEFLAALGQSDNPHKGFVGGVDQPPGSLPPYGYGVYAEPVAATLREYGLDARAVYNLGVEGIKTELLAGRPVMVWATYGMVLYEPAEWVSSDGQSSTVVPYMHTFLITGFDADGLFVLDAYDSTVQHYPDDVFLNIWNVFDQMAVIVTGPLP